MKKYIILPLILLAFSCTKKEVELYNSPNYIRFTHPLIDTTTFSFFFYQEDEVDYTVEVKLIGKPLVEDTEYMVEVDKKTTTLSESLYKLPSKFTFAKGDTIDNFKIRLKNAPELSNKEFQLALNVVDKDNIKSSGIVLSRTIFKVSDMKSRPKWWTLFEEVEGQYNLKSVETLYLGKYSNKKYEYFMQVTDITDMTGFSAAEMRKHSIIFKRWLKKQNPPIYDTENEETMQVNVIGE